MKIFISILLFSLGLSYAQSNYIAVISNPEVGLQSNSMNLLEVVEEINKKQNISHVVVIGNITANGKFDEFVWAQEILDGLIAPYYVVGGERDYLLSEGKGSEIILLWGDDKFFHSENNFSFVCVNSFLPEYPSKDYFSTETLSWLGDILSSNKSAQLISFSYHPIQTTENSSQFLGQVKQKKIFSFIGKEDKSKVSNSIFEGLYLNRKDGWGYLLVSTNRDSIYIKKILSDEIKKKVKPEMLRRAFTKPLIVATKEQTSFISSESKLWSIGVNKTKVTSSVNDAENIFSVFKNGLVLCMDKQGKELWSFETNEKLSSQPALEKDLLVVTSDDGDIITINIKTGNPYQIIGIGEKITTGVSLIDIEEGKSLTKAVVIGTEFGSLLCYDLYALDPLWTQQVSGMGESLQLVSNIVSSNNKIFVQDNSGTLYCFSAINGMLIWQIGASNGGWKADAGSLFSTKQNLKVINNEVFLVDASGNLFCVDALLGTVKWNIKNLYATGLIRLNNQNELILPTTKNKISVVSTKPGKVTTEIELPLDLRNESITDLIVIEDKILVGFSNGWVYKIKMKQKVEKFFRGGFAPIVSLTNVDGNCLVTDYDGRFTLLKLTR
ncbi:MAG: PQQ-binding-like beta-propeller repeat protein [Ignavibacteriaceae bacterium]|nr:PQQ-binding-like beta-propeller repeat protein [Ignavibacteriaceae bacterium]